MTLSVPRVRHYLKNCELEKLFIDELGWDRHSASLDVQVNGQTYPLRAFAEKRRVQIFVYQPDSTGKIPDRDARQKIEKQVTKSAYEHLIIFIDGSKTTQIWQWVARQPGQPAAYHEYSYHPQQQSGEALIQKLSAIIIPLDEEEALDLTGTVHKLQDAFDRDRVTRRFYDHFQREHAAFLKFITGITEQGDKEWYASLMLNRLMFVYFIQQKGFLDGDRHYLRNRLQAVQQSKGKGKFHTFYRYFLLVLFHEGFAKQPKDRKLDADLLGLLGDVPYLNGGLFEVHQLEELYPKIDIPDEAFENLFAFFDDWDWTLDTRPLRNDKEINPDVLGYIFEKYINQKEMGAYYTKEDITEYISKNTVLPHLFDAAEKKCAVAFQLNSALWRLLQDDPDRYIYPAVRQGVIDEHGEVIPESTLPEFVQNGMRDPKARMFNKGYNLGQASIPDGQGKNLALPTETWREYVARRQRCLELREKLRDGAIQQINDLITYNLNIRQFAEDMIDTCEGPELLRAVYQAISSVTVLDPTCGSGAFLFAALNILEPLYQACVERMQEFVEDLERSGDHHSPKKFEDFRKVLAEAERHPNRAYFILKSIVVNNLYGVDIMAEAVEICKLRLFLKLVAQVESVRHLEPLPDIDFNIRAGNTLVGFASLAEVKKTQEGTLGFGKDNVARIEEAAADVNRLFAMFRLQQTQLGGAVTAADKTNLRQRLEKLTDELNRFLATEYGVDMKKKDTFEKWHKSHLPFHWFAEFYGIMQKGGFDVIIGNPPYLERSKLGGRYSVMNYETDDCRDIYAWFVERVGALIATLSRIGLIVPVSIASSGSFDILRDLIITRSPLLWFAHFSNRPGQLFSGAQNRLTILLQASETKSEVFSTRFHRWDAKNGERDILFPVMCYTPLRDLARSFHGLYPKLGNSDAVSVLRKIWAKRSVSNWLEKSSKYPIYWVRVPGYFCQFFLQPPMAKPEDGGPRRVRGEVNVIHVADETLQRVLHAVLNSSTYLQFYYANTDGRHVNPSDVKDFPFDYEPMTQSTRSKLVSLSKRLESSMKENISYWHKCLSE
jgi:hypothetical protein